MTLQQFRSIFIYYLLNVLAVIAAILLIKLLYGTQNFKETMRMACLVPLITLPVFHNQGKKSKKMLLASIIGSFLIPFVIFFIWNKIR
jgi:hypothetical protein